MTRRLLIIPAALITAVALIAGACAQATPMSSVEKRAIVPTASAVGESSLRGKLIILHAGSLTVPVRELTKLFQAKHPNVAFETEAAGSRTTARKVSELGREADLVMSADYTVIDNLLMPEFADWNIRFARNAMVIAYTDGSQYADEINGDNWYDVLTREGVVYGHSEPEADPCGYRTLLVWQLAEKHYEEPGLYEKLDDHCPPENVRPKETDLIALLQTGNMDYAFEYRSIALQHGFNLVELPQEIDLSLLKHADLYSQAEVELSGSEPGETVVIQGKPIVYGVTVPKVAPSPHLAVEFVRFLLGPDGRAIMGQQGQPPIVPPVAGGKDKLPAALRV
ncbi:MAG: tungstate ABC transporter substrate-binding protein WtpA, partial [Anaerolineae bacterium]